MSFTCVSPYVAVNLHQKNDGKMLLKFFSKKKVDYNPEELIKTYGSDNVFFFPCCKCENCRRNYAENWAIRCTLEAKMHPFNYFITLTYDDMHIQYSCIEDLRKFFDRLSGFKHENKFKFFACMEKGENTQRNHFHIILFSDFELDLIEPQWISGFYYYHSKKISDLWTFGFHNVAPFESSCARYVAKYTSKNKSKIIMSRNLGLSFFKKNFHEIIKDNFTLYGDFGSKRSVRCPSFMVKWFANEDYFPVELYKDERKALAKLYSAYSYRNLSSQCYGEYFRNLADHLRTSKKGGKL